jgi:FkbM family methyltransferase
VAIDVFVGDRKAGLLAGQHHLQAQKRIPAEISEGVVDSDVWLPEHRAPDISQGALSWSARRRVGGTAGNASHLRIIGGKEAALARIQRVRELLRDLALKPRARRVSDLLRARAGSLDDLLDANDRRTMSILRSVCTASSNCLDVGAYRGHILRRMVEAAPLGRHIAFEPLPHLTTELRRDFPAVRVMQLALGDVNDTRPFRHVVYSDGYSGFWRRPYDEYKEVVNMISVQVRRLDDVLPEGYTPSFIKVDVEGAELLVFRGGLETLCRAQPYIAFELSWQEEELWDVLVEGAGLCINRLDFWLSGRRPLTRNEFLQEVHGRGTYFFLAYPVPVP